VLRAGFRLGGVRIVHAVRCAEEDGGTFARPV
jgi:hypothetical protein